MHPYSLDGKRILITGASSGIGRASAIEFAKLGAQLVLVARREDQLHATLSSLEGTGHSIEILDLACGERLVEWLKAVAARTGPLDGLLHSAGISHTMPIRATSADLYQRIMSINLDAAYWLAKGFRQKPVRSARASIVFLGSVSGVMGTTGLSAYCASKGALIALTKSLALEFARESIRVNLVAPAHVSTEMVESYQKLISEEQKRLIEIAHPSGIGQPEDVAWAAAYLLSDAARWVTGATLPVDGGYTAQ